MLTDGQIDDLIGDFVRAARQAASIGFDFVDIKHCHGYLGHEFLSLTSGLVAMAAVLKIAPVLCAKIVAGVRRDAPDLMIGVRLSAFDFPPFRPGPNGRGVPKWWDDEDGRYPFGFGGDKTDPLAINLTETAEFLRLLESLGIQLVNLTCCSPYYNPHFMRPATFPPSDGYQPPEDPLVGVARQINAVAALKAESSPDMALVGTGYSYLQDWLPNVAQHVIAKGMVDFVGLGRMVLSYPETARRCAGRAANGPQTHLPHLQRLHHRPTQRHGFRLLSPGRFLQSHAGSDAVAGNQGGHVGARNPPKTNLPTAN